MAAAPYRSVLTAAYGALGALLAVLARVDVLPKAAGSVFLSLLWLGFVLAISCTEAWVKFRAPFVPRHLALDVGRTVFAALNAVEMGLCLGLWLVLLLANHAPEFPVDDGVARLATLSVLLAAQKLWLYPKLNLLGEYALFDALKELPDDALSFSQKMLFGEVRHDVQVADKPHPVFHVLYVAIELAKIALLSSFAFHFLTLLPQ